jgi:hypothetical protein
MQTSVPKPYGVVRITIVVEFYGGTNDDLPGTVVDKYGIQVRDPGHQGWYHK